MLYEFTFVVGGVDPDDDDVVAVLSEQFDALLARGAGVSLLVMEQEGSDAVDAARNAVMAVKFFVPGLEFHRLDRDLVGISEIAERTGHSRQNVAQWVAGERREAAGPFPQVEGVVGRARVWLWGEVNTWLRRVGLGDDAAAPTREEMTDIDYMLAHKGLLTLERPPARLANDAANIGVFKSTLAIWSGFEAARECPWNGTVGFMGSTFDATPGSTRAAQTVRILVSGEITQ